jgi:hypothetical protein
MHRNDCVATPHQIGVREGYTRQLRVFDFDRVWFVPTHLRSDKDSSCGGGGGGGRGPEATQLDVYQELEPSIMSVIDGVDAAVFAYGTSGSGKT